MKFSIIPLLILLFMDNTTISPPVAVELETRNTHNTQFTGDCAFKVDEYDAAVMWNDLRYRLNDDSKNGLLERGEKIGEVVFKVNGNVCLGYRMQNGDATWAEIGTPIYKVKGYSERFRIFLGDELFEVSNIPTAQKIGDFYDFTDKVKEISIEYPIENSPSIDFSKEETEQFLHAFLEQEYVPFQDIYKNLSENSTHYYLRVHFHDQSVTVISYWIEDNAFTTGYGNDLIKKIITSKAEKLDVLYRQNHRK